MSNFDSHPSRAGGLPFVNLIELSVQGGRDVLDGINFIDNNTEGHIIHRNKINGALWEVVDIFPKEMIQKHHSTLLKNNVNIFIGLLLFSIFMLYIVFQEEKKRKTAEYNVLDTNKNLEKLIAVKTIDLQKFHSAIEQAKDATIITNNKGVIEYVNDAFTQVTGFARKELIGRTSNHLKSGKHDEEFYKNMWRTLLAGNPFHSVFINRRKNGDLYHEDKTITPIKDNDGHIIYFIGTVKMFLNA
ncbi:MAG: PAS domain S-box protein [Gammaproteobacteria bacterium]|nr:PAS domain S-box protein [Gammaproteobacteria bacterium]